MEISIKTTRKRTQEDRKCHLLCFEEEVIETVQVDIEARGGCRQEAGPLPAIVLRVE